MKTSKKRIALSGLSILLVLSLLVGGTMAWFTDTEKVDANFAAGVLDITVTPDAPAGAELDFKNLRPLTLAQFDAELQVDDKGIISNANQDGFSITPVYFQPVTVHNGGTLPAVINFSVQDRGPQTDDVINVVPNGAGGVKQDGVLKCTNAPYILKDVLQIFVYENTAAEGEKANWVRVEGVNLNETAKDKPEGYTLPQVLGANESVQYVIGGYLPETTGNAYQAKHFHGWFTVNAHQVDDPDASEVTPQVKKDVEVYWETEDGTSVKNPYTQEVIFLNGATKAKLFPNVAELDNRYELVTPGDSCDITLDKEAGTVDPTSVTFKVKLKEGGGTDPDPGPGPDVPVEPDNPDCNREDHIIRTAADLNNVREHPHCKFILANDIDLSGYADWTPIGELDYRYDPWEGPIYEPGEKVFTGTLDGNGKSITGMNVKTLNSYNGLFTYSSGTIQSLKLDGTVNAHSMSGMLVGWNQGKIENCSTSGSVKAGDQTQNIWEVGGIVGWNDTTGTISSCSSSANVTGNPYYMGYQASSHYYYGGLTGSNNGTLINSYSTGTVKGARAGGLCGYNSGNISYCYTTSEVYALIDSYGNTDTWTHPTVGEMENGTTDKIIANTVFFQKGNLYRNNQVYTGWDTDKYRGLGKTADEMQTAELYTTAGWDSSIWNIADGACPTLK